LGIVGERVPSWLRFLTSGIVGMKDLIRD